MILEITKEDIKELLQIRILPKSNLTGRIEHLKDFPININQQGSGRDLRHYLYIEINTILAGHRGIDKTELVILHGSAFNTIVLYQIDKHMDNKSYYELDELASDLLDCLNNIEQDINYITAWDE